MSNQTSLLEASAVPEAATVWSLVLSHASGPVPGWSGGRRWTSPSQTLEIAGAASPLLAEHGGHLICFDGQLHNAGALREELGAADGAGQADLVALAWQRWDTEAIRKIQGQFALAVWSRAAERLVLARDPAGVYPLFFSEAKARVACAVEAATVLALPWVSKSINRAALADHLSHRWLSWHETHYNDLCRVPAGHTVTWQRDRRTIDRFWYPVDPSGDIQWLRDDEVDQFQEHFDRAIGRCLAQGRTAVFLSGGFDSVSVAASAADLTTRGGQSRPLAASLDFPDASCNEAPIQTTVASQLGLEQAMLSFDDAVAPLGGLIQGGVDLNRESTMPTGNVWRPAYRALGDLARRKGCQVAITGEGGDEWLTVGPEYMADLWARLDVNYLTSMLRTVLRSYEFSKSRLVYNMLWSHGLRLLLASRGRSVLRRLAPGRLSRRRLAQLTERSPRWVSPEPELQAELRRRMEAWTEASLKEPEPRGPYGFYLTGLPKGFLHPLRSLDLEESFASRRRSGLRELQPFWDPELITFLCRIHPRVLDRGGRTKGLVRERIASRFPGLGFEHQRKMSAGRFFSERLAVEGPRAWDRLGGVRTLSSLGIVDAGESEIAVRADVGRITRNGNCRVWELLTMEAWARAHA